MSDSTSKVEVQFSAATAPLNAGLQGAAQAATSTSAAMKSAATGGAAALSQGLDAVSSSSKSAGAAIAATTSQLNAHGQAAGNAAKSHGSLASSIGLNRMQMMEMGHSVRSMTDMLIAGMDPMRAMAMEAPRVGQVLMQLNPSALAAGAGIAALAAAAFIAVGKLVELRTSIHELSAANFEMARGGVEAAAKQQEALSKLADKYDQGRSAVNKTVAELTRIPGASQATIDSLTQIALQMSHLRDEDPEKVGESLKKAFSGGSSTILEFARGLNLLTTAQQEQVRESYAQNDTEAGRSIVLSALEKRYAGVRREIEATNSAAQREQALERMRHPRNPPPPQGSKEELRGTPTPPEDPAAARRNQNEAEFLKTLSERRVVEGQILDIEKNLADAKASGDTEKMAAATTALANARLKLEGIHDPATVAELEKKVAAIHAESVATEQASAARVQAAERERDAVIAVYGATSVKGVEAQVKVAEAQKTYADSRLQIEIDVLKNQQALARDDYGRKVAIQDQILSKMRDAGKQETKAYQDEVGARARLAQQGGDHVFDIQQQSLRIQVENERTSTAQKLALVEQYVQNVGHQYGVASEKFAQAKQYEAQVVRQVEAQKRSEQERTIDSQISRLEASQNSELRKADFMRQMGILTEREELARQREIADQAYAAEVDLLTKKRQLAGMSESDQAAVNQRLEQLEQQHTAKMEQLEQARALSIKHTFDQITGAVSSAISSSIEGVIMGTQTMQQALGRIGIALIGSFIKLGVDAVAHWASAQLSMLFLSQSAEAGKTAAAAGGAAARTAIGVGEAAAENTSLLGRLAKWVATQFGFTVASTAEASTRTAETVAANATDLASTLATNVATGESYAAVGAAAAGASVAAIPVYGWAMSAPVAAETYAMLSGYALAASAAGGWGRVPSDDFPTYLHKDEMVLPAYIANPLRDSLPGKSDSTSAFGRTDQGAGAGNTLNLTYSPAINGGSNGPMGRKDAMSFFMQHSDLLVGSLSRLSRSGYGTRVVRGGV